MATTIQVEAVGYFRMVDTLALNNGHSLTMTWLITFILFAAAILLADGDNSTSAATSAEKAKPVTTPRASSQESESKNYDGPLFPAVKNGKYGFIDINGKFVIPPIFTAAKEFSEGMAAVYVGGQSFIGSSIDRASKKSIQYITQENGKWGYIDRTGEIKIPPQFNSASPFSEGLALVTVAKDIPAARSLEEWLTEARPLNPGFSDAALAAHWVKTYDKKEKAGYVDAQGLFKIIPQYDAVFSSPFKNGVASVRRAERIRLVEGKYIDSSGSEIEVNEATLREASEQYKNHWIDTSGNEIDGIKALSIVKVNRIAFEQKNTIEIHGKAFEVNQYGLKDKEGNIAVNAKFDSIGDFYRDWEGKAYEFTDACIASTWQTANDFAFALSKKCGLIDINGNFVVPPDFDAIGRISEGLAIFTIGCDYYVVCRPDSGKKGIFSIKERKIIANPQFDEIQHGIFDGLIAVKIDGKWGYVDASGKSVIPPQFTRIGGVFKDGLAQVGLVDYIDRTGKYVYKGSIGALRPKPDLDLSSILDPHPSDKKYTKKLPVPAPDAKKGAISTRTGSGFVISRQGHVLTNNHVVDGCTTIRTTSEGSKKQLTVVGTDPGNDLALLKLPSPSPNIARFREGRNVRAGDGVVVVGFPLHGLLASEANVTTGTVSALAGIGNDTRFLQITASVQPGNSGGPLLDQGGNIVGIVVSKLNAMKIAKVTGDIPQNINFAINGVVAKSFLDANSVEYELATSGKKLESSDVGGQAKKFTLLLECFK